MNRIRLTLSIIAALLLASASSVYAQTATWAMQPRSYSELTPWQPGLYKAKQDGKIGIIKANGEIVVPIECDTITPFHDGYALAISFQNGNACIMGNISQRGAYTPFSDTYYPIPSQEFYSDGMLTAKDTHGKLGYLTTAGQKAIGFDGKFSDIKPFTEGYGVVVRNGRNYALIDKSGRDVAIVFNSVVTVVGITNAYNGKSYLMDSNGKWYEYDLASGNPQKTSLAATDVDYLFCIASKSKRPAKVQWDAPFKPQYGMEPVREGALYGYKADNGTWVLPCQFNKAEPFINGYAIVTVKGKKGIVRLLPDEKPFAATAPKGTKEFRANKPITLDFSLQMPEFWASQAIDVTTVNPATGETYSTERNGSEYAFEIMPAEGEAAFSARAEANGLLLASLPIEYQLKKRVINTTPVISVSILADRANADDIVPVSASVTNPSEEPITTTVTLTSPSSAFAAVSRQVTIEPGKTATINSYFKVTERIANPSVNASTTMGGSATAQKPELLPYY